MTESSSADFVVIGAGIAGASAAAELAAHGRVVLLEMESQPGYHATGRSAAFFAAAYGSAEVRALTGLSEQFLVDPPDGFCDVDLIRLRDCMFFGTAGQQEQLLDMRRGNPRLVHIDGEAVQRRVPILSADTIAGAMWDEKGGDIDVDALLQGYVRLLRRRGGELVGDCRVGELRREGGQWVAVAGEASWSAPVVVNAAGAWADGWLKWPAWKRLAFNRFDGPR